MLDRQTPRNGRRMNALRFARSEVANLNAAQRRERLVRFPSSYNGILLAPHLDDGGTVVRNAPDADARAVLGLDRALRLHRTADGHRGYLRWHPELVFNREPQETP